MQCVDMAGKRYGRLFVLRRAGSNKDGLALWLCKCDCGNMCVVEGAKIRKGNTRSCGCLHVESTRNRFTKHGLYQNRLYGVWKMINQRCSNPRNKNYGRYGGRGISVCEEWRNSFQAFYEWAILHGFDAAKPSFQCTIDRIDNDRGYYPENCRFVDMKVQNNNKSNTRKGATL